MDWYYLENCFREDLKRKCPQLPDEIVEEYINLTFFGATWVTYGDNKDIYLLGLAENKYDFYYMGCNDQYEIELISCALDVKKNKERENEYITKFNEDFNLYSKRATKIWKTIRKNIKQYFKTHKEDKLIYFRDHLLVDEHIVYDNEDHTEYHIEKVK